MLLLLLKNKKKKAVLIGYFNLVDKGLYSQLPVDIHIFWMAIKIGSW